jgi:hypothetical protein
MVSVEEYESGGKVGFVDYLLRLGDHTIVVEAKRLGATFPSPTRRKTLRLSGTVLSTGEMGAAIRQADGYGTSKNANVIAVTNGLCWCFYAAGQRSVDDHATLLFPFTNGRDAEELFRSLSLSAVKAGSLDRITNAPPRVENRLLGVLDDADARIDRNTIADYIIPALNTALSADALVSNAETLARCFVSTEARAKFSSQLGMYLADPKPILVQPARRIRKERRPGHLESIVRNSLPAVAPPVTLIIGPVGAGKSTYLKHFELVAGADVLREREVHWVYIDFEEMGKEANPRRFLYQKLRDYLAAGTSQAGRFGRLIEDAYRQEIESLAYGPLAPIRNDKTEYNRQVATLLKNDFDQVEPYVDKVFRHIAATGLCVLVLDNIDLYEDDALETLVFAEGLALSKRVLANVIVSVRDKTFVQHRNDSVFNAYELRKLWLDPPPFKAVLSTRLTYSRKILEGKTARIALPNGMFLQVPDLGVFFDIVQKSILRGAAGDYIESVADLNIRKGLTLVANFLTSGHIHADKAVRNYVNGNTGYFFPFHEVFKGTMLGQWRYYCERRAECTNLFDSRLGSKRLRLLRLIVLQHLLLRAQQELTIDVPVEECVSLLASMGASQEHVVDVLRGLEANSLIRTTTAEPMAATRTVHVTRAGGYFTRVMTGRFVYAEECMGDTAIEDSSVWQILVDLTSHVTHEKRPDQRMRLRLERIRVFMDYLCSVEASIIQSSGPLSHLASMQDIRARVLADAELAIIAVDRHLANSRDARPLTSRRALR